MFSKDGKLNPLGAATNVIGYFKGLFRQYPEAMKYLLACLIFKDGIIALLALGGVLSSGVLGWNLVENVLYGMPGILEAAVVGVPDPVLGEAVKAFVTLKQGVALTEREVIKYCLSKLESFMVPKQVAFVAELPKTDTGKIKKTGLA